MRSKCERNRGPGDDERDEATAAQAFVGLLVRPGRAGGCKRGRRGAV